MKTLGAAAAAAAADIVDPPDDAFDLLGYRPTPKQHEFHSAAEFDVLYGGAAGGGKTKALLMEGLRACRRHPGIWVGGFRRTYDELEESFLKELRTVEFAEILGANWRADKRELIFTNGSVFRFRFLETVDDATRRQGGEYQLLLFDERGLILPQAVEVVCERMRSGRRGIPVLGIRSGSNPIGVGHGYLKARYVDATGRGAHVAFDDQHRTVRFIPAKIDDNPHLDAGYIAVTNAIPDPARRRAMRDGDWDVLEGQAFAEWDRARHLVSPFEIPASWKRHAGIDFGYSAPFCVLWGAIDGDDRVWIYRELYSAVLAAGGRLLVTPTGEHDQARRIVAAESGDKVLHRAADPSMWAKHGDADSIADVYMREGVWVEKAENDRLIGKTRVHTYLGDATACTMHRAQGWETCPRLHVLDGAAPNLVRTLPGLPRDEHRPEDVDTKAEDHCFTGTTIVDTLEGPRPVEDLVDTTGWTFGADGHPVRYRNVRLTRRDAELVRVELEDGRAVTCTPDHLFLTPEGWRPAHHLDQPGHDYVAGRVEHVRVVGVSPAERADVYDLDIEHPDHAFTIEGGLIVHNCYDALRYLLMSTGGDPTFLSNQPSHLTPSVAPDGTPLQDPFGDRYATPDPNHDRLMDTVWNGWR